MQPISSLSVGNYVISGLDDIPALQDAWQTYLNNQTDAGKIAYNAAVANTAAALTSEIVGEGAAYAGNALIANMVNLLTNRSTMSLTQIASADTSILGDLATMIGQGITIAGLAENTVTPFIGGPTFTLGQAVNAAGFILSAIGAGLDAGTIKSVIQQDLQQMGLTPNANGIYTAVPNGLSNSNFVCDASNFATMWDIVQENNTDQISATPSSDPNSVATVIVNGEGSDIILSPGTPGNDLTLEVNGDENDISGVNSQSLSGDEINLSGNNNSANVSNSNVSLSSGSSATLTGTGNDIKAGPGSSVTLNPSDSNTVSDSASGASVVVANGSISASGNPNPMSGNTSDVISVDSDGSENVRTYNSSGFETSNMQINSAGQEADVQNFACTASNNYETSQINYDVSNGAETSDVQLNASGQEISEQDFIGTSTNNYETDQFNFNTSTNMETSDEQFDASGHEIELQTYAGTTGFDPQTGLITYDPSNGAETSSGQFNSSGQETGEELFVGTVTNNYETDLITYSTSTGMETSDEQFNSSGWETDIQYYPGTVGADLETNQVNYSTSNGAEISNWQYNAAGQETDEQDFVGTTTDDYETNQINYNVLNNMEISNWQFNAAGKETDEQDFTGTTTNDYETNQINYSTLNGMEISNWEYNSAGQETAEQVFIGTTGNDYETNQINYNVSNNMETSNILFNSSGQETEQLFYAGTTTNDYETEDALFNPEANYSYEIYRFNSGGAETQQDLYNQTTGRETDAMYFNPTTELETEEDIFNPSAGPYADEIIQYNTDGWEVEDQTFNASTGAVESTYLWDGSNPYAYEEEFSDGGGYFYEIDDFNPVTGALVSGTDYNSLTGAETNYYNGSTWTNYAPGDPTSTDYTDTGAGYLDNSGFLDDISFDIGDDPIILNLNGGTVQTTSLSNSSTNFDIQNNGQPVRTAWGTAGEGYLVYDPNDPADTAVVSDAGQLVSGFTQLQSLAQQADGTATGVLDASDSLWKDLKVWVDTTGTGQFQSGQLVSLDQLGITSIDLNAQQINQGNNGNTVEADSTFTWANGTTGDIAGVKLDYTPAGGKSSGQADDTNSVIDSQVHLATQSMSGFAPTIAASSVLAAQGVDPETVLAASAH
ncbi:beta strand repeat-containing protein [Paraburkholderia humisilvae]|uniref:Uncharacterized protein n=1 Tax=Paraburkholderia humisilvae TaxID=627669 RepID=A0A6J5CZ45_9BURK|nr:hypothetical protein [Paraburkholderia humisilvae]CAB3746105.1 hypothetical protein LMG29542_00125 [Paraburkholderia humisilvae]